MQEFWQKNKTRQKLLLQGISDQNVNNGISSEPSLPEVSNLLLKQVILFPGRGEKYTRILFKYSMRLGSSRWIMYENYQRMQFLFSQLSQLLRFSIQNTSKIWIILNTYFNQYCHFLMAVGLFFNQLQWSSSQFATQLSVLKISIVDNCINFQSCAPFTFVYHDIFCNLCRENSG